MKKIRRFAVGENAMLLTAEQMRQIGGGTAGCSSSECWAYLYYTDGHEEVGHGSCGSAMIDGYYVCACSTDKGTFPGGGECDDN